MNFGNGIIKIHSTAQALPVKCSSGSAFVATKLPKMGGKKKRIVVAEIWELIKKKVLHP